MNLPFSRTSLHRMLYIVLFLITYLYSVGQSCNKPLFFYERINSLHIQPLALNDSLSRKIFNEIFYQVDPEQNIFCKADIIQLSRFEFEMDNEIKNTSCLFINSITKLAKASISRRKVIADSIFQHPLSFSETEYYPLPIRPRNQIAESESALKKRMVNDLKYEIFITLNQFFRIEGKSNVNTLDFDRRLPEATAKVKSRFYRDQDRLDQKIQTDNFIEISLLKSIAQSFDPHSDYFSTGEMQQFNDELNSEKLSFGLELTESSTGDIVVSRTIPGGPAWKAGQFHSGDQLIEIKYLNREAVDVTDFSLEEMVDLLNDPIEQQATISFINSNGENKTSTLLKSKIENTENSIYSYILKSKDCEFGYVHLPGFFSIDGFENHNGCANEVAKEIIRLNRSKVQGLILDLRFNGGGHVAEAIDLAGIFIDSGPLAIFEEREGKIFSVKDLNKGQAFFGPMVIIVNGFSASASEFLAAAMQDYQRAVIVGGPTFGKSTGQIIVPLKETKENTDFLKTTIHKIFRINQTTVQYQGVIPDIQLPDLCDLYEAGEKNYNNPMLFNSIQKKTYYSTYPGYDITSLRENSKGRVTSGPRFESTQKLLQLFKSPILLTKQGVIAMINELLPLSKEAIKNLDSYYEVQVVDNEIDPFRKETADKVIPEIKSSEYVQEAFLILSDIIKMKK